MALTSSNQSSETPVELVGVEVLPDRIVRRPALVRPEPVVESPPPAGVTISDIHVVLARQEAVAAQLARVTQQTQNQGRINAQVLAVIIALCRVLAVRFLLFLSLIGAFVLALEAMSLQTMAALAILVAYSVLTLGPLVILEVRHGRSLPQPQAG